MALSRPIRIALAALGVLASASAADAQRYTSSLPVSPAERRAIEARLSTILDYAAAGEVNNFTLPTGRRVQVRSYRPVRLGRRRGPCRGYRLDLVGRDSATAVDGFRCRQASTNAWVLVEPEIVLGGQRQLTPPRGNAVATLNTPGGFEPRRRNEPLYGADDDGASAGARPGDRVPDAPVPTARPTGPATISAPEPGPLALNETDPADEADDSGRRADSGGPLVLGATAGGTDASGPLDLSTSGRTRADDQVETAALDDLTDPFADDGDTSAGAGDTKLIAPGSLFDPAGDGVFAARDDAGAAAPPPAPGTGTADRPGSDDAADNPASQADATGETGETGRPDSAARSPDALDEVPAPPQPAPTVADDNNNDSVARVARGGSGADPSVAADRDAVASGGSDRAAGTAGVAVPDPDPSGVRVAGIAGGQPVAGTSGVARVVGAPRSSDTPAFANDAAVARKLAALDYLPASGQADPQAVMAAVDAFAADERFALPVSAGALKARLDSALERSALPSCSVGTGICIDEPNSLNDTDG